MIEKTFQELIEVDGVVGRMYKTDPTLERSKFGYGYTRFFKKNILPVNTEYTEALNDIYVNWAMENEQTKEILVDRNNPRGFKYTKEGLKKVMELERQLRKEYDEKIIEVEPYISSYVPEGLADGDRELLEGLII